MDETAPNPESDPEPLSWSNLDPKLTKAIVAAQSAISTVENDSRNKAMDFPYASSDAILSAARAAMSSAGISLMQLGWPQPRDGMVYAEFVVVHPDGPTSPVFGATMPLQTRGDPRTSLAASLTFIRKYVYAGLLNMTWNDPKTDVEADVPGKAGAKNQQQNRPQQQQAQRPQKSPAQSRRDHDLNSARMSARKLIIIGIHKDSICEFATGVQGLPIPENPPTSVLHAITLAGNACNHARTKCDEDPPRTHDSLMSFIAEHTDKPPLWSHGKRTPAGDSVDEQWPVQG